MGKQAKKTRSAKSTVADAVRHKAPPSDELRKRLSANGARVLDLGNAASHEGRDLDGRREIERAAAAL